MSQGFGLTWSNPCFCLFTHWYNPINGEKDDSTADGHGDNASLQEPGHTPLEQFAVLGLEVWDNWRGVTCLMGTLYEVGKINFRSHKGFGSL
jgi:hypothetical protein